MSHTVSSNPGQAASKECKRYLSYNMLARDSDFQKAPYLMRIVQTHEQANQGSS